MSLELKNLSISVEDKQILKSVNVKVDSEVTFLLGRNGSGKSTLAQSIIGDARLNLLSGNIIYKNEDITSLKPEERSKKGIFVSFQNPPEIEGISMMSFLHTIYVEKFGTEDPLSRSTFKFRKHLLSLFEKVNLNPEFIDRSLNVGFSGGEKKRSELIQIMLLQPNFVILDEVDSGLDVHALDILNEVVKDVISRGGKVLFISHNIDFIKRFSNPNIFLLENGEITAQGGIEVLDRFLGK